MAKLVSKTYGEALFEIAMEKDSAEMLSQIEQLKVVLKQNPDFDKLMTHPGITKQEKSKVLQEVFDGRVSEELMGFLQVIISKERYKDLPDILDYFIARMKEYHKIGIAYVTTAKELSATQKAAVEAKLLETTAYVKMEMNYNVDPALIGGMIIRINDRVVDSSVKSKIEDLTQQLLQIQLA